MNAMLEFILLTQSPALFLAAVVLLLRFFILKKNHRVRGTLNLIGAIVCLAGGVALYYLGMLYEHFTIRDFWHIRVPGWVGLGLVAVLAGLSLYRSASRAIAKRRAEKAAAKAEAQRIQELEDAKNAAYESGKADALAESKVVETVAQAAEVPADGQTTRATDSPAVEQK